MRCATFTASLLAVALAASMSSAGTISSDEFSIAYGATGVNSPVQIFYGWATTENAADNTPTTQGDFAFEPAPYAGAGTPGDPFQSFGPTFSGRVLADGPIGGDINGYSSYAGSGGGFVVPIVASYTGTAPADASATPDYRLSLNISKISIYGVAYTSGALTTMVWDETTPGNVQTQPSAEAVSLNAIGVGNPVATASNYKQLVWNAGSYSVSLANLGDTVTRTFAILPPDLRILDGLEIEGNVMLQYNSVPEPSSLMLLSAGLVGLLAYAWKKRR